MPLAQLPLDRAVHVIADWFEFSVIVSEFGTAPFSDLQRIWDRRRNSESSAPDGRKSNSDGDEAFLETVLEEIRTRIEYLREAYPFKFSDTGESLELIPELEIGQVVYLFCLLLANAKNDEVFCSDKFVYELDNYIRDLFQACSTWAAAGFYNCSASSFGFPRPDGTNFLDKLRAVYALVGEGAVRVRPLPGVSSNPKDEGVDVIAWARRNDGAPGKVYFLGQVATGSNWHDKSIVEYLKPFHENWFSVLPASQAKYGMFIPHCVPTVGDATLQQQIHVLTVKFGDFQYRYTIPFYASKGCEIAAADAALTVERQGDIAKIRDWVNAVINKLQTCHLAVIAPAAAPA